MNRTGATPQTPLAQPSTAAEQGSVDTRQNPLPGPLRWLPGTFFVVSLLLGAGAAVLTPETWNWPNEGSFWRGEQAALYEQTFNENLPFRDTAISTWGVLEYTLLNEGREGVLVGSDGWLFTDEEVAFYEGAAAETARKLRFIERAQTQLAERGVALIVALIPDKLRVYAEHVGRPLPSYTGARYRAFRAKLVAGGVLAPDLLTPLQNAKAETQVYLRTDTHWTPAGAEVVAATLAAALTDKGIPGLFETKYETETTGQKPHEGDLLAFLPLGALQGLGPPPDRLETRRTQAAADTGGGLFGALMVPVTLIGTSYSANENWNFTGALQKALGADVLNLAAEGQGPLPPMRAYLDSTELRDAPPTLVVWEIPERYLPVPEGTK